MDLIKNMKSNDVETKALEHCSLEENWDVESLKFRISGCYNE